MPESPDLYAEVANLRDEIEEQGSVTDALLRASAAELKQEVLEAFDKDPSLGKILQLVDGERSQNEILEQLREQGEKGANKATISRKFDRTRTTSTSLFSIATLQPGMSMGGLASTRCSESRGS